MTFHSLEGDNDIFQNLLLPHVLEQGDHSPVTHFEATFGADSFDNSGL